MGTYSLDITPYLRRHATHNPGSILPILDKALAGFKKLAKDDPARPKYVPLAYNWGITDSAFENSGDLSRLLICNTTLPRYWVLDIGCRGGACNCEGQRGITH